MPEVIYQGDLPAFTGRNVPIKEIASAIGKDAQYVRLGIQQGLLKFGTAIKVGIEMRDLWQNESHAQDTNE